VAVVACVALAAPSAARAAEAPRAPVPILPDALRWASPPGNAAARGAWVIGAERERGPYLFRVALERGARIPPHVHPDARSTTVLSGTLYVGFGATIDEAALVAVPAGAVYLAPAGVPHWVTAKDGPVVYQEAGSGPTGTRPCSESGACRSEAAGEPGLLRSR
jgi:quercetin dioxygenase-like cupin family protein